MVSGPILPRDAEDFIFYEEQFFTVLERPLRFMLLELFETCFQEILLKRP